MKFLEQMMQKTGWKSRGPTEWKAAWKTALITGWATKTRWAGAGLGFGLGLGLGLVTPALAGAEQAQTMGAWSLGHTGVLVGIVLVQVLGCLAWWWGIRRWRRSKKSEPVRGGNVLNDRGK